MLEWEDPTSQCELNDDDDDGGPQLLLLLLLRLSLDTGPKIELNDTGIAIGDLDGDAL